MDLEKIQEALRERGLGGWLFCDFHSRDQFVLLIKDCDSAVKVGNEELITRLMERGRTAHPLGYEADMLPSESEDLDPEIAPISN